MRQLKCYCKLKDKNHKNWVTTAHSILTLETDCPICMRDKARLSNEEVDKRLIGRNIERLEGYKNNHTKMLWGCTKIGCNNKWLAIAMSILNNKEPSGCPECNRNNKNENLIAEILNEYAVNYSRNYNIKKIDPTATRNLTIDFYLHDFNIGYEYDGKQHKEPVCFGGISMERAESNFIDQQERDQYKNKICKDKITLIRIDGILYKDKKLKEYIKNYLEAILSLKRII